MRGTYGQITEQIVSLLHRGVRPWTRPWTVGSDVSVSRPLRANGEPYGGINILLLWSEAFVKGFSNSSWMTYRQASELGGQVRKGEQGTTIFYSSRVDRTVSDDETGEERRAPRSFLRAYTVFNVDQIDGLSAFNAPQAENQPAVDERLRHVEAFIAATGATIGHGGPHAFYAPSVDRITMPELAAFPDQLDYYATLLHELVHWTRHKSRLDRDFGQTRFGDHAYAMEELVAELGAAFLCADLALTPSVRDDHAAYMSSWLDVLGRDDRAIFNAAAHAQRALEYLQQSQTMALQAQQPFAGAHIE